MTQITDHTSQIVTKAAEPISAKSVAEKAKPLSEKIELGSVRSGFDRVGFEQAIQQIQKFIEDNPRVNLSVRVDDTLNRPVMSVVDPNDGEVMQIPSEEVIKIAQNIELMRGVFFDQKA